MRACPPPPGIRHHLLTVAGAVAVAVVALTAAAPCATAAEAAGRSGVTVPARRASSAAAPRVAVPALPAGLPSAIEEPAAYVKQDSCDPVAKPGTLALGRLLTATYPGTRYGIARACGTDGMVSEHVEGRALDWMVSIRDATGAAKASALIGWLQAEDAAGHRFANARRLGVMYVIWNDRIWGAYAADSGWRPYSTCAVHPERAYDTGCHRDHVHISLSWAGAMAQTSFWTRHVAAQDYGPCRPADLNWAPPRSGFNGRRCAGHPVITARAGSSPTLSALIPFSGATVGAGSTGPVVVALQKALGVGADGKLGPQSAAALSAFRTAHGLPAGTTAHAPTWRALLAAASSTSGGARTSPPQAVGGSPSSGSTTTGSSAPGSALTPYFGTVLRHGSQGQAVTALQRVLKVRPLSGWFGPLTAAAVMAFQRAHHLPATGVVEQLTWRALAAS